MANAIVIRCDVEYFLLTLTTLTPFFELLSCINDQLLGQSSHLTSKIRLIPCSAFAVSTSLGRLEMETLTAVPASDPGLGVAEELSACGICKNAHGPQSVDACTLQACEHSFHKACLVEIQTMAVIDGLCPMCSHHDPLLQVCQSQKATNSFLLRGTRYFTVF